MKTLLLFFLPLFALGQVSKRPNVVLFMADDMGMLFTDAHTPSSRCTTTRYGLLTGRYPWRPA